MNRNLTIREIFWICMLTVFFVLLGLTFVNIFCDNRDSVLLFGKAGAIDAVVVIVAAFIYPPTPPKQKTN